MFCLHVDKSYNDQHVFGHLIEQVYPQIEDDSSEGDQDSESRSFIVVFDDLSVENYLEKVDKLLYMKLTIRNYFYAHDLGLKLVEIQKAHILSSEVFTYYKNLVISQPRNMVSCKYPETVVQCIIHLFKMMKSSMELKPSSSFVDIDKVVDQETEEFNDATMKLTDERVKRELQSFSYEDQKAMRQFLNYVKFYEEDDEDEMLGTDKINALRMLDEKNKEISDGSRQGGNRKNGEGSINESMKSSLMQSEVRLAIMNAKNEPIMM